jgi:hypothetical protein
MASWNVADWPAVTVAVVGVLWMEKPPMKETTDSVSTDDVLPRTWEFPE